MDKFGKKRRLKEISSHLSSLKGNFVFIYCLIEGQCFNDSSLKLIVLETIFNHLICVERLK